MEDKKENQEEWVLEKVEIEYNRFGDNKGMYTGRITFKNKNYESFHFVLYPEMTQKYLELIANEVVKSAEELTAKLIETLGLAKKEQ